ncbi:MAG: SPOR domain-containing protein [Bacteroidota bacterium]
MQRAVTSFISKRGLRSLAAALVLVIGIRCSSSTESTREESTSKEDVGGGVAEKYELQFNPADYNASVATIEQLAKADTGGKGTDLKTAESSPPETTLGFRIQILSTTEIDTANAVKTELSNLPESIGIYVIYDAPYYKVRVGDYLSRPDANSLLRTLIDRGYSDAWIVADRILKDPPLRKPPVPPAEKTE